MFELFEQPGTEAKCNSALEHARWPPGFHCPRCGGATHGVLRVRARKTFQCNAYHHQTSLIAGTLFEGSTLALTVRFLAIYLFSQAKTGLSALATKHNLGVSYPAAWIIYHKLTHTMVERESYVLCGTLQVDDDACLGGKLNDGTAGGASERVPFVAAVSLDQKGYPLRTTLAQLTGFTRKLIAGRAAAGPKAQSAILSAGPACFASVTDAAAVRMSPRSLVGGKPKDCRCVNG